MTISTDVPFSHVEICHGMFPGEAEPLFWLDLVDADGYRLSMITDPKPLEEIAADVADYRAEGFRVVSEGVAS